MSGMRPHGVGTCDTASVCTLTLAQMLEGTRTAADSEWALSGRRLCLCFSGVTFCKE
jgi:hypothetical protein